MHRLAAIAVKTARVSAPLKLARAVSTTAPRLSAEPAKMATINLTPDGGIVKQILKEGSGGSPPNGSNVKAHYTGRFLDGKVFDSSVSRGRPFTFTIGVGQVIKGWDVGIASMKVGEKCILTCKPEYAYGRAGAGGVIPPNATLAFEVELLDFM